MSDILQVLTGFPTAPYSHILPSLDRASISTVDLITLTPQEIAKRAQVPPAEVAKLTEAATRALQDDNAREKTSYVALDFSNEGTVSSRISTLDSNIDALLEGGIRAGFITEITGESGVGKTQFLLILLLAAQLPPPQGLGRSALYISTEAALSTSRLGQLLHTHPILSRLSADERPTLDKVLSIQTPDLESQEHIIRYQVPVAIRRHDVGLIVIDSIAANYRAEFEPPNQPEAAVTTSQKLRQGASVTERRAATSMAERKPQLVQIGAYLRNLARTENIAIVVANQIADRFSPTQAYASSYPAPSATPSMTTDPLTLDHQQRWFTGWGDLPTYTPGHSNMKTPSLGLVWTNQISARIALIKENQPAGEKFKRRRWMRVVFATWASPSTGMGIEYDISAEGVRAVVIEKPASVIAEE